MFDGHEHVWIPNRHLLCRLTKRRRRHSVRTQKRSSKRARRIVTTFNGDRGYRIATLAQAFANTTLAVVVTNAKLRKVDATKIAQMAHDGLARAVDPAHTSRDGDTIFAAATGAVDVPPDLVGVLAASVVADAIVRGVRAAARARES